MGVAPTNYVLRQYMSETDAINDTNALQVANSGDGALGNWHQNDTDNTTTDDNGDTVFFSMFLFEKYWFRIESNEQAIEFEIDWDDGEDNSPEKSNTTKLKYKEPRTIGVVSHVFTKHGAQFPLIRAKNVQGFWSKWYTPYDLAAENGHIVASNDLTTVTEASQNFRVYDAGQNEGYRISMEKNDKPRIPTFLPASKPPTCVLKVDRNKIWSGIDNYGLFHQALASGASDADKQIKLQSTNSSFTGNLVQVTYVGTDNITRKEYLSEQSTSSYRDTLDNVREVLEIKLLKNLENKTGTVNNDILEHNDRIEIITNGTDAKDTIGSVSLGCPILKLNEPGYSVLTDMSESVAVASNVTINQYWLLRDEGVHDVESLGDTYQRSSVASSSEAPWSRNWTEYNISDEIDSHLKTGPFSHAVRRIYYSLNRKRGTSDTRTAGASLRDWNGRFLTESRLLRGQVSDTGDTTVIDQSGDTMRKSFIEHFQGKLYWDGDWDYDDTIEFNAGQNMIYRRPEELRSYQILLRSNQGSGAPDWVDMGLGDVSRNMDQNTPIFDGMDTSAGGNTLYVSNTQFSHVNEGTFSDGTTIKPKLEPENFLFMAKDKKYNKVYFRVRWLDDGDGYEIQDNWEQEGKIFEKGKRESDGTNDFGYGPFFRLMAWYPAYQDGTEATGNIIWKPLAFVDNTKYGPIPDTSLYRSGSIIFDEPSDWLKTKHSASSPTVKYPWASNWDDDSSGTDGPKDKWTVDSYAIVIGISGFCGNTDVHADWDLDYVLPCSNTHTQEVMVYDPHHVSINSIGVAQSVSYKRGARFQKIQSKLGTTEIRRIGLSGGEIKIGGVDLNNPRTVPSNTDNLKNINDRDLMYEYHRDVVPVFYDLIHSDGDITRFFGIITDISEDHPTGSVKPKWAVNMTVSHIAEFDSTGNWISDGLVSLGGEIRNVPRFLH